MARSPDAIGQAARSVMDRLKSTARNRKMDANLLITRYALERWLHRLSIGPYADRFVLKGGMIMPLLGDFHRPTQDIDGNLEIPMTDTELAAFVAEVCQTDPAVEDGVEFDLSALKIDPIRDEILPGARLGFSARIRPLGGAQTVVRIKVDLCSGDAITPDPVVVEIPSAIKGFDSISVHAYPWPTVIAEKLHALARHGAQTSRMKDIYDLLLVSRSLPQSGSQVSTAIAATFAAWNMPGVPRELVALSDQFAVDRQRDWARFAEGRRGVVMDIGTLADTVSEIRGFVGPAMAAASTETDLDLDWLPGVGWSQPTHVVRPPF